MTEGVLTKKKQSTDAVNKLLDKFGVKKTRMRRIVLLHLLKSRVPQSHREIMKALLDKDLETDSVTLYRTLSRLVEVGLIHRIPDSRYLLCSHLCRRKSHIVLNCETCDRIWEIADARGMRSLGHILADYCALSQNQLIFLNCICKICGSETHKQTGVLDNG